MTSGSFRIQIKIQTVQNEVRNSKIRPKLGWAGKFPPRHQVDLGVDLGDPVDHRVDLPVDLVWPWLAGWVLVDF